jgi:hypothetical protein
MFISRIASRKCFATAVVSLPLTGALSQSCSVAEQQNARGSRGLPESKSLPQAFAPRGLSSVLRGFLCLLVAVFTCCVCADPCIAQSVTFGSPVIGGEATTQNGGIVTSTFLPAVKAPAGIATNKLGTFYMTDSLSNAVYSFIQPAPGAAPVYTQMNFSGLNSPGAIAVDGEGDVYVTDSNNDRIVELTAGGSQQIIPVPQSGYPIGVAVDASGNVYFSAGFAYNSPGAVFKLAAGSKTPVEIGTGFSNPKGLAVDQVGNLFIADYSNQRIVEISSSGTQAIALSLTNFPSHVTVDSKDDIFTDGSANEYVIEVKAGTTDQVGVLANVIPEFSGLTVDGNGNVFAVQGLAGDGAGPTLYESSTEIITLPQTNVCQTGGNSASGCTSSVMLPFWIWNSIDLGAPRILTQGAAGLDFSQDATQPGSCTAGQITLPANGALLCNVVVNFTPQAAGPRKGAVQIVDSSGNILVQLFLYGLGIGPQLSISVSGVSPMTVPIAINAGNASPAAVGADAAGNIYVTEAVNGTGTYTSAVYKVSPSGSQTEIPISDVFSPGRVEIDGAGDLYFPAAYADYEFPSSASSGSTPPAPLLGNLHGATEGLSIDGLGDTDMVSDNFGTGIGEVYRATFDGSLILIASSTTNNEFGDLVEDQWLLEADSSGHFEAPIAADGTSLVEVSPSAQSFLPFLNLQTLSTNFSIPQGSGVMALGPGGDIYFSSGVGIFDTAGRTVFPGINGVTGPFTIDSQDNLYVLIPVSGTSTLSVLKVPAIQQPYAFTATQAGSASSTQEFTVFNSGNATMSFSSIAVSDPFALDASKTTCSTSQSLATATSCAIGVKFNPTTLGAATGNLTVAVAGLVTPEFVLTGTGIAAPAGTRTALNSSASNLTAGNSLTLTATVTVASGATPQGTVTFMNDAVSLGSAQLNGAGVASFTLKLAAGSYSIIASYGGTSADLASTSAALAITVTSPATTSTSLSVTPNPASYQQTVSFAASVTGAAPTGTVTLTDGSNTLDIQSLGTAPYTNTTLAPGQHLITASYSGDANNQPSTSLPVTLTIAPFSAQMVSTSATTISPGDSVTANVSISSMNNYSGTILLSCAVTYQGSGSSSDAPACSVAPASLTLASGGTDSAALTVTTTTQSARLGSGSTSGMALCGFGLGGVLLLLHWSKRTRNAWLCFLLVFALSALPGCNSTPPPSPAPVTNPGTGAGKYVVTLTSTSGQITTTQSVTITVQ